MAGTKHSGRRHEEYANERDMETFWAEIAPQSEPFKQKWFLPLLILFIVLSVPWYRSAGAMGTIILGLPTWVWTTLICSVCTAALTAFTALCYWKDRDNDG